MQIHLQISINMYQTYPTALSGTFSGSGLPLITQSTSPRKVTCPLFGMSPVRLWFCNFDPFWYFLDRCLVVDNWRCSCGGSLGFLFAVFWKHVETDQHMLRPWWWWWWWRRRRRRRRRRRWQRWGWGWGWGWRWYEVMWYDLMWFDLFDLNLLVENSSFKSATSQAEDWRTCERGPWACCMFCEATSLYASDSRITRHFLTHKRKT